MYSFALTGGVATGKSTFGRILKDLLSSVVLFDCDAAVGRLLADPSVGGEILLALGQDISGKDPGGLDRTRLRERVFQDVEARERLEGILHPLVRQECLESQEKTATNPLSPLFVADVPLLFESGFDFGCERSLLVATTRETQMVRLKSREGYDDTLTEAILAAQLPIMDKVRLADVIFWNEGPHEVLRRQVSHFLRTLEL